LARHPNSLANLRNAKPAPKGNSRPLRHGADSVVALAARTDEVYAELAKRVPVREAGTVPAADETVLRMLALNLARIESVTAWIEEHGELDSKGRPHPAAERLDRLTNRTLVLLRDLGMTPRSRAALGVDLARSVDLVKAMSEPDPQRRAELMREAGLDDD